MHTEAVTPQLLGLLRKLMTLESLAGFSLGGGTSLALRFGHRQSIDIDLFTGDRFDGESILDGLHEGCSQPEIFNRTPGSLCLGIDGVKVDLLHHAYDELAPPETLDHLRLVSLKDLAAMKINAVTNRGSKKDFTDLLMLHQNGLSLTDALDLFCSKYGQRSRFLAIRSLQFFGDAQNEPDPVYLNGWTWETIESDMTRIAASL